MKDSVRIRALGAAIVLVAMSQAVKADASPLRRGAGYDPNGVPNFQTSTRRGVADGNGSGAARALVGQRLQTPSTNAGARIDGNGLPRIPTWRHELGGGRKPI